MSQITYGYTLWISDRPTFMISISDCAHCILLNRHIDTSARGQASEGPSTEVRSRRLTSPTGPAPPRPRAPLVSICTRLASLAPLSLQGASVPGAQLNSPCVTRVLVPPRMRSGVHTPVTAGSAEASAVAPRIPNSQTGVGLGPYMS